MAKALALGLAGALALGALATTAFGKPGVESEVSIANTAKGVYAGKIESKKAKCTKKRKVTVYHDTNRNGQVDTTDFTIGSKKSSKTGTWTVTGNQAPSGDTVIAVADEKPTKRFKCKKGTGSTTAVFSP